MKNNTLVLLAIVTLASCSTPKYAYYFDHHNYDAGRKQAAPSKEVSPLQTDPQVLVASTSNEPAVVVESRPVTEVSGNAPMTEVGKTYAQMNKSERKAVRHYIKKEVKKYVAEKKKNAVQATQAGMDHDLKLAVIFGAIGIVGLLIGGEVFWIIGGIALLIGVVFFVKWIIRQ